jgi:hypothetical protein
MDTGDDFCKLPVREFPSADYAYRLEWEGEWRVPGGLCFRP